MRLLLLAANFYQTPYPVYPLGAAVAAATATRAGHQVRLCDLSAEGSFRGYDPGLLARVIAEFGPECVGLSIRNVESADSQSPAAEHSLDTSRRIVSDIRKACPAPIVLGGSGFSLLPELFLRHTGADFGLVGEAEATLAEFLQALAAGRADRGLWRAAGSRPEPSGAAPDPILAAAYAGRGGLIGVQTKRGCPLSCLYCSYPVLEGRAVRARPVGEVLRELRQLSGGPEKPHVAFADAVFNDAGGGWRELLRAMIREGLDLSWTGFFQPFGLDAADLQLIKAAGAAGLEFGTDAASDACLRGLRKPFAFAEVRETQALCARAGVPAAHYIVFGGPGETRETVEEGLANLASLERCVILASIGLSIYPGTALHELALAEGVVGADEDFQRPVYYHSRHIDPPWLAARLRDAFKGRRDRVFPLSAADEKTAVLRRLGFRGLLWDTLIRS